MQYATAFDTNIVVWIIPMMSETRLSIQRNGNNASADAIIILNKKFN